MSESNTRSKLMSSAGRYSVLSHPIRTVPAGAVRVRVDNWTSGLIPFIVPPGATCTTWSSINEEGNGWFYAQMDEETER